jgi:hypothetical protein
MTAHPKMTGHDPDDPSLPAGTARQSPLCPDSDQIPHRTEMTRCATNGLMHRNKFEEIHWRKSDLQCDRTSVV